MPFISFSCLIAVAGTFNFIFKKSGESEHPSFVPDFKDKAFSFSSLNMLLYVGLSHMDLIMLSSLHAHVTESFYHEYGCWILSYPFLHLLI